MDYNGMKNAAIRFVGLAAMLIGTSLLPGQAAAEKVIKLGHLFPADASDNTAHACAVVFKSMVETGTNGSVTVQIFPSGQLGKDFEVVQQVRDGIVQGNLTSVGGLASHYPRIGVIDVAFAFPNISATYDVFDGEFGKALAKDIESELGDVKVLGFTDTGGFFSITNSKRPIANVSDMEGLRIRTMTLDSHQTIIQALGAEAYPLAWAEVYTGLQTGVIDGQMNPIPIIASKNFQEVQGYLTLTNHLFTPFTFVFSKSFYDELSDSEKDVVHVAARNCVVASRGAGRIIEASEKGLARLQAGMEVTALTADQLAEFKAKAQPAIVKLINEKFGERGSELLELFLNETAENHSVGYMR